MVLASTIPTQAPSRPILNDAIERPWVRDTKVGDSTVGAVAGRALQFQLEGTGTPSERKLVPQTAAAAKLLEGPKGAAVEQALRGIIATTDAHDGATNIAGISLARGYRDFQVNSALTWLEKGDVPGWDAAGGSAASSALQGALEGGKQLATMAVAQAPGWVNIGPFATRQLLRLAGSDSSTKGDLILGTWLAQLAAHEPHHTITPPSTKDLAKAKYLQDPLAPELEKEQKANPFAAMKPVNWLEEGTADVLSSWAGVLPAAGTRLGLPHLSELPPAEMPTDFNVIMALQGAAGRGGRFTPEERVVVDKHLDELYGTSAKSDGDRMQMIVMPLTGMRNYPVHVAALHEVLRMGGLEPNDPAHLARASKLLQGDRITHVAGNLADEIIEQRDLSPEIREDLRVAIRDLGAHLNGEPDESAVNAGLDQIAKLAGIERAPAA